MADFSRGFEPAFFFVDRISGGIATLLGDGAAEGEISLPVSCLPPKTSEGDYLALSFEIDAARRESINSYIDLLFDELGDNP
ncbi:MAG: DUF3006 domain-containing protein [Synergistaceae bacterium]|jgi:hypothetical protein|nr:DUF3006 domain-containing protein [Synergistaceae bacterium]